jgi:hypothetical protein
VALIPVALLGGEALRHLPRPALVLPLVEAALEADDVGVAELAEGDRGVGGAHAAGAADDDLGRPLGDLTLDVGLEPAARDVERPGDRALLVLVGLADVEHQRRPKPRFRGRSVYLLDLGLRGGQKLSC